MRNSMAVMVTLAFLASPAGAQDAPAGASLAVRWCMACHIVGPNQSTATDNAPSCREIAARPGTTAGSQERNALVTYILSLR